MRDLGRGLQASGNNRMLANSLRAEHSPPVQLVACPHADRNHGRMASHVGRSANTEKSHEDWFQVCYFVILSVVCGWSNGLMNDRICSSDSYSRSSSDVSIRHNGTSDKGASAWAACRSKNSGRASDSDCSRNCRCSMRRMASSRGQVHSIWISSASARSASCTANSRIARRVNVASRIIRLFLRNDDSANRITSS